MKTIYVSIFVFLTISLGVASDPAPKRFEFEKAAAIYHLMKDGGIIYLRPNEYNEAQGFIRIYEALDQYLYELDMLANDVVFDLEKQPLLDEFLLVNGTATKSYLLKDGWFGDGDKWVPMSREDYAKLRSVIDERKDLDGSKTAAEGLKDFTARIQEAGQQNGIPEFETQFNRYDQEKVVAVLESNGKESSRDRNASGIEEVIPVSEGVRSESINLTETGSERIAKEHSVSSNKEILEEVDLKNISQVQEIGILEMVSGSHWKWSAIFAFFIAIYFIYVQINR